MVCCLLILDDWWQFNDSKVSSVPESKILSLDGGGESDTAYSTPGVDVSNFSFALSCEGVSQKVVGAWRWIKVGHFSNSTSYCMNSVIFLRHTHELSRIGTTSCIRSLLLF